MKLLKLTIHNSSDTTFLQSSILSWLMNSQVTSLQSRWLHPIISQAKTLKSLSILIMIKTTMIQASSGTLFSSSLSLSLLFAESLTECTSRWWRTERIRKFHYWLKVKKLTNKFDHHLSPYSSYYYLIFLYERRNKFN